jgi:two-component system, LytTR family, sensor histidine kinase AlgZ
MHAPAVAVQHQADLRLRDDALFVRIAYCAAQIGWWGWHFWWYATGEAIFAGVPLGKAALVWGGFCLAGITATELLRRLSQRWGWLELPTGALVVRIAISVAVLTAIGNAVTVTLATAVYASPVTAIFHNNRISPSMQLVNELTVHLFTYLTWIAVYFCVAMIRQRYRSQVHQARLSESLQATELRLLKSQLNPHFLFNALNGLRALIADDPARARNAVTQLAHTLRYTLDAGREEFVTLAQELAMVDDYLALESLRLAARLQIVREIDPQISAVRIPVMLLQTLVENAIKHGIAPLREGGTLYIRAFLADKKLQIEVENPRSAQTTAVAAAGLGLSNTARRLELLYSGRARIHLDLSDGSRAKATARLPV